MKQDETDKILMAEIEAYYSALRSAGCDVEVLERTLNAKLHKRSANGDGAKEPTLYNRQLLVEFRREAERLGLKVTLPMRPGLFSR